MSDWHKKAAEEIDEYLSTSGLESNWDATKQIAAIIERHDPNRWIATAEQLPDAAGENVEFVFRHPDSVQMVTNISRERFLREIQDSSWFRNGATHWRPIVLPEVKP